MTKAKENEVSRRDFIKDLGGGAIGAAIISTDILAPRPVDAADAKVTVKPKLNKGQLGGRWNDIRGHTKEILKQFSGLGAMQVNWRLNVSGKVDPLPVFIDWLATEKISEGLLGKSGVKIADIGERRLGDSVLSTVYDLGLKQAGKDIVLRNWMDCDMTMKEKKIDSQLLVQKAGLWYQKFIGILAQEPGGKKQRRCVGLLTVSFPTTPSAGVDDLMKKLAWADNPKSEFVKYIEGNFVLGGPFV